MRDQRELVGWVLFLVCAGIFVAAGVRDGDPLMTAGSVMFLAGCVLFLWSFPRR